MDENNPAGEGLTDANAADLRKRVLYDVYFSGGNLEWYAGYHGLPLGGDLRLEDFRTDKKWPDYRDWCDRFYFATHPDVPADIFPDDAGFFLSDLEYGVRTHHDHLRALFPVLDCDEAPADEDMEAANRRMLEASGT